MSIDGTFVGELRAQINKRDVDVGLGRIETIPFSRTRMTSRRLSKGSRLVVLLDVNKNSFAQLNYGTGKDVSDESIADATPPLRVRWRNDSLIVVPFSKQ